MLNLQVRYLYLSDWKILECDRCEVSALHWCLNWTLSFFCPTSSSHRLCRDTQPIQFLVSKTNSWLSHQLTLFWNFLWVSLVHHTSEPDRQNERATSETVCWREAFLPRFQPLRKLRVTVSAEEEGRRRWSVFAAVCCFWLSEQTTPGSAGGDKRCLLCRLWSSLIFVHFCRPFVLWHLVRSPHNKRSQRDVFARTWCLNFPVFCVF